jgi:uncharacterized membrane protein
MVFLPQWRNKLVPLSNDVAVTFEHRILSPSSLRRWFRSVSVWGWIVAALSLLHAVWMIWIAYDLHYGLGTFSYDVGLYDQGVWLMSRGHEPFVTFMGRNLLGDHASLIMLFLVPVYWVAPGVMTLLVVQALVVAAGTVPIYLLAKRLLNSGVMACGAALMWLANPALNGGAMENFHPDSFLALFIPMTLYAAFTQSWKLFAAAVLLSVLVKEDVLLVMVPIGLFVAWRFDRRRGLIAALASVVVTILGMFVMMRHLIGVPTRNGWRIPFGGVSGFIKETFTNPTNVMNHLMSEDRPMYLFKMMAPFAGLFFAAPSVALLAVPVLASNVVSTFWYQHQIEYHYSIVVVPLLLIATLVAIAKLNKQWRPIAMALTVMCSLVTFVAWGIHPLATNPRAALTAGSPFAQSGLEIIKGIPDDSVVSAYDPLTAHLGHRRQIYFFPNPFKALYYGVDDSLSGKALPAAKDVEYVVLPRALGQELSWVWEGVRPQFKEIDSNQFWQVFQRVKP